MKLEYPLNEALPNIEHTRDRLLTKIFRFRKEDRDGIDSNDEDFELLYAYGKSPFIDEGQWMAADADFKSSIGHWSALKRDHRRWQ